MNLKKDKIYIASPYSNGWMPDNVRLSFQVYEILMNMGFAPFCPLAVHFQSIIFKHDENAWLEQDLNYLLACKYMVRIHPKLEDGKELHSPGADLEEKIANENNIHVFHYESLEELRKNFPLDYSLYHVSR